MTLRYYLFFICIIVVSSKTYGQDLTNQSLIQGNIKDNCKQVLPGVSVSLIRVSDSTRVLTAVTNNHGDYHFKNVPVGRYLVKATFIGFKDQLSGILDVATLTPLSVPALIMESAFTQLKDVSVTAARRNVEVKNGKLIYNVEQSVAAAGSSVFDLLRRTPGISVDQNQNLLLKGSASVNVMLDGKMTYLSAQQLSNMLSGMNADQINRIEVITAPSAQYDAAGNAGIINIVTRKSNKQGYAANVSAGATLGRYLLNAESVTGNVKTSKFNFFGSAGYSYRHTYSDETSRQIISANDNDITLDRKGNNPHVSYYYSYKAGTDVYLSKKQQIGFVYTGSTDDWSKDAAGTTFISNRNGQPSSVLQSQNYAKEPYYNNAYNLNYKFNMDTTGKILSADADYISYRNNSDGYLASNAYDLGGNALQPYQRLNFHQPSNINISSIKMDLDLPFKTYKFKTGLKYSSVTINNNFKYDSLQNDTYVFAPSLSDHFIYKEEIAAAYVSASKQWTNTSIDAGLRLEHTYSDGNSVNTGFENKRTYTNLFPSLAITRQLDKNNKLDFSVSSRINRPNYGNLNPARYFSDKYAYYQGNPNLIAEKAWVSSLAYTLLDKYIASLSYNRATNLIATSASVDPLTGILVTSTGNYPHKDRLELQLIVPFTITSSWEVSTTATLSYTDYPLTQLSGYKNVHKTAVDLFADQTFQLPGKTTLEVMTRYTTPDLNGVYMERYYFSMDGGLKKSFLNKKLDARFAFADLFHTGWFWGYSISNTANYSYKNTPDSRRFNLTMVYHLGGKLSGSRPHQIEEQQRL